MMFLNVLVLAAFATSCSFVSGGIHSTCYVNETYCLFSFGPNVTVNNVNEAQKICEDAKNGSWLLEIVDENVLQHVNEFLSNHSFPEDTKLIFDAEQVGNEWRWIKNKSRDILKSIIYNIIIFLAINFNLKHKIILIK